jgi:hypothetical protein
MGSKEARSASSCRQNEVRSRSLKVFSKQFLEDEFSEVALRPDGTFATPLRVVETISKPVPVLGEKLYRVRCIAARDQSSPMLFT